MADEVSTQDTVVIDDSSSSSESSDENVAWVDFRTLHIMLTDPAIFKNIRGYAFDDDKYHQQDRKCWKLVFY